MRTITLARWLVIAGLMVVGSTISPCSSFADEPVAKEKEAAPADTEDAPPADAEARSIDVAASKIAFDEGAVAQEECRYEDASNAYWKAIDANYRSYRAHARYQVTSLRHGGESERTNLIEDYDTLVKQFPKDEELRLHRLRLDPLDDRLLALAALAKKTTNFNVMFERGSALFASGDMSAAIKELARAMAVAPVERTDVALLHAEALWKSDTKTKGSARKKARAQLEAMLTVNPELWSARILLARIDLDETKYDAALKQVETAVTQRPSYVAAFLLRAEIQASLDKIDEALKGLESAQRVAPEAPEVLLAVADITAKKSDEASYKAASALYLKVLEKQHENVHALFGLAWVREREKNYKDAMLRYKTLTTMLPESPVMLNSLGFVMFKQGRVSEAQVQFKRAIDLDEDFVDARLNLGATYDKQAKYTRAIKIYEEILRKKAHKENLRAMINCAFDYEELGTYTKAAKLLERAHEIKPKDSNIMVWLGDNFYFQKKYKKAINWYKQAIVVDGKSFYAWRGVGYAYGGLGKWEECAKSLEEALKIKPGDNELRSALAYLYLDQIRSDKDALKHFRLYKSNGGDDPDIEDVIDELVKKTEK